MQGWKTGWVLGPKPLMDGIWTMHQNTTFCSTTPLQEAIAVGFEKIMGEEKEYFPQLQKMFQSKRDRMVEMLRSAGLEPIVPQGSYFVLADFSKVKESAYLNPSDSASKDFQFSRWLPKEIGVSAIPPTAFVSPSHSSLVDSFVRFCFCKNDQTFAEAEKKLQRLKQFQ